MGWSINRKRKKADLREKERVMEERMLTSQSVLLDAVREATSAAEDVTYLLRSELDDSLRQIELTAGILNDGLLVCTDAGTVLSMNPAAEKLFLQSVGHKPVQIKKLLSVNNGGGDFWASLAANDVQITGQRADGQTFPASVNLARLDRSDATITYLLIVRPQLMGESNGIRNLLQAGLEGVLIVAQDHIIAANPALSVLLGYAPDEIVSLPLGAVIDHGELSLFRANSREFIDAQFDTTLLCRDGSTVGARVTLTHLDWAGQNVCVVTMEHGNHALDTRSVDDIIRCFGQDYSLRSARVGRPHMPLVCHLDRNFNVIYANSAFCAEYGFDKAQVPTMALRDLIPAAEYEPAVMHLRSLKLDAPERALSIQFQQGNKVVYQEWVDSLVTDADGTIIEYIRTGRVTKSQR